MDILLEPNNAQNDQNQVQTIIPQETFVGLSFGNEQDFINFLVPRLERENLMDRTRFLIPFLRSILTADEIMPYQNVEEVREDLRLTEVIDHMTHFIFMPGESVVFKRDMFIVHMSQFRFAVHPYDGYYMDEMLAYEDDGDNDNLNENHEIREPQGNQYRARNGLHNFQNLNDSDDERAENEDEEEGELERLNDLFNHWHQQALYEPDSDNENAESEDEGGHEN